ncbi:MAG: amidohydrolase, partial [Bacteroidia bacterium]|nr:amidohydrolase [Bacteroidia bacterium]
MKRLEIKHLFWVSIIILFGSTLNAQTTIISGATIHVGNGQIIENGVLVIEKNKIVEVGSSQKNLYKNATVIEAKGKHIYPGLIALNNIMGLNEIDAVRATRDYQEQGEFNPNVRSAIAFNTDSKILPTALYNGVLYTQAVPQGGVISGSSALLKVKAWIWENALVLNEDG